MSIHIQALSGVFFAGESAQKASRRRVSGAGQTWKGWSPSTTPLHNSSVLGNDRKQQKRGLSLKMWARRTKHLRSCSHWREPIFESAVLLPETSPAVLDTLFCLQRYHTSYCSICSGDYRVGQNQKIQVGKPVWQSDARVRAAS